MLDAIGILPITFITAPAGAGKTTLAAGYAKARRMACVWLQLEADNADPASFVYYLRLAVQRIAPRRAAQLPLLTAEYRTGLPAFAMRLFDMLAKVVPAGTLLVLDNYEEVGGNAALHAFLAEGLRQLRPGIRVLYLSRQAPPAALARRRAEGMLAILEWEALRFTVEETAALVQIRHLVPPAAAVTMARQLHERAQGWAAGLTLLLEAPVGVSTEGPRIVHGDQASFDYLASEVFQRMDPGMRELLPSLAIVPAVSEEMAVALTGHAQVGQRLEELVRSNCFTTRDAAGYIQFHPLFRSFLLDRLQVGASSARRDRLQRIAAKLLLDENRPEEAAQMLIDASEWAGLADLIVQHAQVLLAQGRHETVTRWLDAPPTELRDSSPWLLYYRAAARFPIDLGESRQLFERALKCFNDLDDDSVGLVRAWFGLIQTVVTEWSDSTLLAPWVVFAERRIVSQMEQLAPELQGRVIQGMFLALQFHQPQHPQMHVWVDRLESLVNQCADPSERIQMGSFLLLYYITWLGDLHRAERLVFILRPERLESLTILARIHWHCVHARWLWQKNAHDESIGDIEHALALAKQSGMRMLDFMIHVGGFYASMNAQNIPAAERYLEQAQRIVRPHRLIEAVHHQCLIASLDRLRGNAAGARKRTEWAVSSLRPFGNPFEMSYVHIEHFHSLRACGEFADALAHAGQALTNSRAMHGRWREYLSQACIAEAALVSGDVVRGLAALREAFAIAREQGYRSLWCQNPKSVALLCDRALAANIEPEHCRALVAAHRLVPPGDPRLAEHWPFPVRVRSLGPFHLVIDGQPLHFHGKPQRKPLELLKALVALGASGVRDERLSAILWPDADSVAARSAFSTTLARLRKLLGGDDTVVVHDGQVSINPRLCWLDTWALEAHIAAAEQAPVAASDAVLGLYRGAFLQHDSDVAWAVPARERLRSRFVRFLTGETSRLVAAARHGESITLYLRGIEVDPLIEEFHRGLMGVYIELGRPAEALAVFERCRLVLTKMLGVQPSQSTRALAERLRGA